MRRNKAPLKGNGNAINQIRTNENALDTAAGRWNCVSSPSASRTTTRPRHAGHGRQRPAAHAHLAQTPNDGAHAFNSQIISDYILGDVLSGVPASVGPLPNNCSASYEVPFKFAGQNFRGGNALVRAPTHWRAIDANPFDAREVCARSQLSLNTCNGCHFGDSGTSVLPTSNGNNNPRPAATWASSTSARRRPCRRSCRSSSRAVARASCSA